jgi:hypothetical protein
MTWSTSDVAVCCSNANVRSVVRLPADSHRASSVEMVTIDPLDLKEAQDRDVEIPEASSATMQSQSGDDPRED